MSLLTALLVSQVTILLIHPFPSHGPTTGQNMVGDLFGLTSVVSSKSIWMSSDGACFFSLSWPTGPSSLLHLKHSHTHSYITCSPLQKQSKTTFLSPITTPPHTHTHAPLSLATILQKPFWKIFWSELLDVAGRQRQHLVTTGITEK